MPRSGTRASSRGARRGCRRSIVGIRHSLRHGHDAAAELRRRAAADLDTALGEADSHTTDSRLSAAHGKGLRAQHRLRDLAPAARDRGLHSRHDKTRLQRNERLVRRHGLGRHRAVAVRRARRRSRDRDARALHDASLHRAVRAGICQVVRVRGLRARPGALVGVAGQVVRVPEGGAAEVAFVFGVVARAAGEVEAVRVGGAGAGGEVGDGDAVVVCGGAD